MKVFDLINKHITRKQLGFYRGRHYYPSEASVSWIDNGRVLHAGKCMRQTYYRLTGIEGDYAEDSYLMWMALQGKGIEEIINEQLKQMGLWVNNNMRFYNPEYNISGEVDIVIMDPDLPKDNNLVCLEAKSFHGYMAKKHLVGSWKEPGRPKDNHLLQLLLYLKLLDGHFAYGKLIYKARDTDDTAEFDIRLHPQVNAEGNIIATQFSINGIIDYRFTVDDILDRYKQLDNHVKNNTVPLKDYDLWYSPEEIEIRYAAGEIGKTKYTDWKKKGEKIGDWQCRGCVFKKMCYTSQGNPRD